MNAATLVPGAVDENYSWVGKHYRLFLLNAAAASAITAAATIATAIIATAIIATAVT